MKTPPFSDEARREAGRLLRLLQDGEALSLPHSRPMPGVGAGAHELRVADENTTWRVMYAIRPEEIVILDIFQKKTQKTPKKVLDACARRLKDYDEEE